MYIVYIPFLKKKQKNFGYPYFWIAMILSGSRSIEVLVLPPLLGGSELIVPSHSSLYARVESVHRKEGGGGGGGGKDVFALGLVYLTRWETPIIIVQSSEIPACLATLHPLGSYSASVH